MVKAEVPSTSMVLPIRVAVTAAKASIEVVREFRITSALTVFSAWEGLVIVASALKVV
jgi:hypothetical protein